MYINIYIYIERNNEKHEMYGHIKSYDATNNNFDMYVAIRDKDKCNT